jgi:hypothetical protein
MNRRNWQGTVKQILKKQGGIICGTCVWLRIEKISVCYENGDGFLVL